jgi:hypothetical protein
MRYIKYNEELKSSTYKSAADKLSRLGHTTRSSNLTQHSLDTRKKEKIEIWQKHVDTYSKYGKIKVNISKLSINEMQVNEEEVYFCFYPYLDTYSSDTYFLSNPNSRDAKLAELGNWVIKTSVTLEMWIIPQTIEQFDRISEILEPENYEPIFGFQTNSLFIKLELEPNSFEFTDNKFYYEDGSFPADVRVVVADRPSAGRIKILLKKFFNDSSLDYPLVGEDNKMYRTLLRKLLADPGISNECGISMEDFSEYISRISPNTFYTE